MTCQFALTATAPPSFIPAEILCLADIPRVEIIVLKSGGRGTLSGTSGFFLGSTAFAGDAFFGPAALSAT